MEENVRTALEEIYETLVNFEKEEKPLDVSNIKEIIDILETILDVQETASE
jgi:uncharacterized protein Yka (UPF0111/DUF47 family)